MMTKLRGLAVIVAMALLIGAVSAQEIKVTTSPNPVRPGGKVRVTLQSGIALNQPAVVVNGNRVALSKVTATLYTASIVVPTNSKLGMVSGTIKFLATTGKELAIPFQYEVSNQGSDSVKATQSRAGEGGSGLKLDTNVASELNIKVDQLEDRLTDMQRQRELLNAKVKNLNAELARLKTQKKPASDVQEKQLELENAKENLARQQKEMEQQNAELQSKLNELADRESSIKEREKKVSELESTISQSREKLAKQADALKSDSERIKLTEAALLKREEELSKQRDDLADKNQDLKSQAEKLQAQQEALQSKQDLVKSREAELAALQKRLGLKNTEVQDLAASLAKDRNEVAKMQDQMKQQRAQVAAREKAILESESALKKRQAELMAQTTKYESDRAVVQQRESDVKTREAKLSEQEQRLTGLKSIMDERQRQLSQIDAQLKSEKSGIELQKKAVDERQRSLSDKERELSSIENELSSRNQSLKQLSQALSSDQKTIEARQKAVLEQRQQLMLQSQAVNAEKEAIRRRDLELKAINDSIRANREKFELEVAQQKQAQKADRQEIERRKSELSMAEKKAAQIKADLDQRYAENATREANMLAMSKTISSQMAEIQSRELSLKETELKMAQVRKDIFDKYSEMEDLKIWVQKRTVDLQEAYAKAKETREESTAQFQEQFVRLEKITKSLQDRTTNLTQLNQSLEMRNNELEIEIRERVPTQSQFSMCWYLGYHSFDGTTGLSNGGQGGLRFVGQFNRDWNAEIGLGVVPTMEDLKSRTVLSIDANFKRDFYTLFQGKMYWSAGLTVDMATQSSISPQFGIGAKWLLSDDYSTRIDLIKSRDFLALVGFEKKLIFDEQRRPTAFKTATVNVVVTQSVVAEAPVIPPKSTLEILVSANPIRYQYQFKSVNVADAINHWASANLIQAVRLGLLSPVATTNLVMPSRPLTMVEAAKMLAVAVYLPKAMQSLNTPIEYAIVDKPGVPYYVDLTVVNDAQAVVRHLMSRKKHQPGEYDSLWDGRTDSNTMAPTGSYQLVMTVYNKGGEKVSETSTAIQIYAKPDTEFLSKSKLALFSDVPIGHPDQVYINDWVDMGNTSVIMRNYDQSFTAKLPNFQPDSPISRLSFIIAVSNAIQRQGVQNYVIADLSPYRDIQALPLNIKSRLGLYISELNYGGDDQQRLRPFENLTRAEAATIIARYLNWHCQKLGVIIPD